MPRETPVLDRYPIEDITQLADGHVAESFAAAVAEVAANIRDEHTSQKPKRKITVTVEFVTAQDRSSVQILTNVTTKLAPKLGRTVPATFARDGATLEAFATQQNELPGTTRRGAPAAVTPLRAVNDK
jgi:hypothetical protein